MNIFSKKNIGLLILLALMLLTSFFILNATAQGVEAAYQTGMYRQDGHGNFFYWVMNGFDLEETYPIYNPPSDKIGAVYCQGNGQHIIFWQADYDDRFPYWVMDKEVKVNEGFLSWRTTTPGFPHQAPGWTIGAVQDMTGNGTPDVIFSSELVGGVSNAAYWQMDGFEGQNASNLTWGGNIQNVKDWDVAAVEDMDGSGSPEVLWQIPGEGKYAYWRMNDFDGIGAGWLMYNNQIWNTAPWELAAIFDMDGSGSLDIIWQNVGWGQFAVWHMDRFNGVGTSWINYEGFPTSRNWPIVGVHGHTAANGYTLTMAENPSEGGSATDLPERTYYLSGETVNIAAEAAENFEFQFWSADAGTFADENDPNTTFTMPSQNVTVTANFLDVEERTKDHTDFIVTQEGGAGITIDTWDVSAVATGEKLDFLFQARNQPDKFTVYYGGVLVFASGWVSVIPNHPAWPEQDYPGGIRHHDWHPNVEPTSELDFQGSNGGIYKGIIEKEEGIDEIAIRSEGIESGTIWDYILRTHSTTALLPPPVLTKPFDGEIIQYWGWRTTSFLWEPVSGAESYGFELYRGSIQEVYHDKVYSAGVYYELKHHDNYSWRVATRNEDGNLGPWSDWFTFTYQTPLF